MNPDSTTQEENNWDWVWLYYFATVFLNMSEPLFWKTTPRKLSVLISKYMEINGLSKEKTNEKAFEQLIRF